MCKIRNVAPDSPDCKPIKLVFQGLGTSELYIESNMRRMSTRFSLVYKVFLPRFSPFPLTVTGCVHAVPFLYARFYNFFVIVVLPHAGWFWPDCL